MPSSPKVTRSSRARRRLESRLKREQSGGDAVLSVVPMDLYWIWRCEGGREVPRGAL